MNFDEIFGKALSCGFIIIDSNTEKILACHPTGHAGEYDLPKGHIEEGETPIQCAVRELKEETGIELSEMDPRITDCGETDYTQTKNLHLFIIKIPVDLSTLTCTTTFTNSQGVELPEMDSYELFDDTSRFYRKLQPIIEKDLALFRI